MENASKALIIAGAILLSILLISLGIMIFTQAENTVNKSGMTQAEIQAFNNKFIKYEGKQNGSVTKSLINEVISSNADDSVATDVSVVITAKTSSTTATSATTTPSTSAVSYNSSYSISITKYEKGYVSEITIAEQ